ncbi:MAG: nucleoside hydrolase [Erysipelotrichaceae bacterium]
MTRKLILDVDTGSDDACAIMLAALHKDLDLVAVCSVSGNVPLVNTTENSLRVLQHIGKSNIPVYKGCDRPLIRDVSKQYRAPSDTRAMVVDGKELHIHQDYLPLEASTASYQSTPASIFYVDYLMNSQEKIDIVAVGPLTNLAVSLMIEPRIVEHINEIVIMVGTHTITNETSSAEFNIFYDPEAAQRVLKCGAKITMVSLDATHKAYVNDKDAVRLRELNTNAANFAAEMIEQRIFFHKLRQPLKDVNFCALHDPLAVAYLIDPSVLKGVHLLNVEVSLGDLTDGQTVVNRRYFHDNRNVNYAFDGDRNRFVDIMCEAFK